MRPATLTGVAYMSGYVKARAWIGEGGGNFAWLLAIEDPSKAGRAPAHFNGRRLRERLRKGEGRRGLFLAAHQTLFPRH